MSLKVFARLALLLFLVSGCTKYVAIAKPAEGQEVISADSIQGILSKGKATIVAIAKSNKAFEAHWPFCVRADFVNLFRKPVSFSLKNIEVLDTDGSRIKIYTKDELIKQSLSKYSAKTGRFMFLMGNKDVIVANIPLLEESVVAHQEANSGVFFVKLPKLEPGQIKNITVKVTVPETRETHEFAFAIQKA